MGQINTNAILAKGRKYTEKSAFKKQVQKKIWNFIMHGGSAGDGTNKNISAGNIRLAAEKFIDVLNGELARSVPSISGTVSLSCGRPRRISDNQYAIDIRFSGNLHRDSLYTQKYGGIDNIVALFNNGYSAKGQVYGTWHGKRITSRESREGLNFIDRAKNNYMALHASQYGVIDIEVSPDYY